MLLEHVVPLEI